MLKPAAYVAAVCVLLLLAPIPFLAELALRAFITATAILSLLYLGVRRDLLWAMLLGVVAVLFNPITNGLRPSELNVLGLIVHAAAALTLLGAGLRLHEEDAPPPPGPGTPPPGTPIADPRRPQHVPPAGAYPPGAPPPRRPQQRPPQWQKLG